MNSPLNNKKIKWITATKKLTLKLNEKYAIREGISEGSNTKYEKGGGILSNVLAPDKVNNEAKAAKTAAPAISLDLILPYPSWEEYMQ